MKQFALWLSATSPSVFIQEHNAWTIPLIQSMHILGIALVMGSVLMIDLRILGWAGADQTTGQTARRFGPWLTGALWLMLASGLLMVVGQPTRELMAFSFRLKMALVVTGTLVAVMLLRAMERPGRGSGSGERGSGIGDWGAGIGELGSGIGDLGSGIKLLAIVSFLAWVCIIVLGRLIAYDHVWGAWSPSGQ